MVLLHNSTTARLTQAHGPASPAMPFLAGVLASSPDVMDRSIVPACDQRISKEFKRYQKNSKDIKEQAANSLTHIRGSKKNNEAQKKVDPI